MTLSTKILKRAFLSNVQPSATATTSKGTLPIPPALNFNPEEGIPGLWSPETATLQILLLDQHQKRLQNMISRTDLNGRPLLSIMERCVREKNSFPHQKILQQAGLYWASDFFLRGLTGQPGVEGNIPRGLERLFESEFEVAGIEQVKRLFNLEADSLFGNGWLWLVRINAAERSGKLGIISTLNGWTPMSLLMAAGTGKVGGSPQTPSISQMLFGGGATMDTTPFSYYSPVLGISMFENAYIRDFGINRKAYLDSVWKHINWSRVAILLNIQ